jgi:putative ABC transport system permease protein
MMVQMRDDLKAAFRSLRSSKDVALAALIVLTLGIGATTAIFSVVDAVVLRALPFDEHDRLVAVGERRAASGRTGSNTREPDALGFVAPQNYMDWAARQRVFESIAAIGSGWLTLREPGVEPESLVPQRVTAQFFDVLRVRPAIGRVFAAEHEVSGRDRVAVLSDAVWRRRFGGDPRIVGRTIPLDDVEAGEGRYEVLGVMPPGFAYPVAVTRPTDIWIPYVVPADQRNRSLTNRSIYLQVIARLKPGVSLAAAQAQMNQIAAALETANPQWNKDSRIGVRPLIDHIVGSSTKSWMLMLLGSVGIVLLIACANVANLLLARATARERDIGIRAALGASRTRLVRQLMIESLLLSILGTAGAIVIGWWAVEILRNAMPDSLPRVTAIALNLRVLAAAAGLSLMTAVLFGAVPALLRVQTGCVGHVEGRGSQQREPHTSAPACGPRNYRGRARGRAARGRGGVHTQLRVRDANRSWLQPGQRPDGTNFPAVPVPQRRRAPDQSRAPRSPRSSSASAGFRESSTRRWARCRSAGTTSCRPA